jgi:hypothetical protein
VANTPKAELDPIRRDMAQVIALSNQISASPAFPNLQWEAELWAELAEWTKAKEAYARIVARFSEDEERKAVVARTIVPTLAYCMLQLREMNDAKDVLAPLVHEGTPTKTAVQYYAMAIVGWLEGGTAGVTAIPGAGGTDEEFAYVTEKLTSIQNSGGPKWTNCEWYEDKLAELYAYYVWGQRDDRKKATAKSMMETVHTFLDADVKFASVDEYCTNDSDTPAVGKRLRPERIDAVLRRAVRIQRLPGNYLRAGDCSCGKGEGGSNDEGRGV